MNEAHGIKVDVDFQVMVEQNMRSVLPMRPVRNHNASNCYKAYTRWSTQDMCVRQKETCIH